MTLIPKKVDINVGPRGSMELLSQSEVALLTDHCTSSRVFELFRQCSLAVLNTGNESDDAAAIFDAHRDYSIEVAKRTRGLKLIIKNAPGSAIVDGRMIEGVRQHLFSVLRDIIYMGIEIPRSFDLTQSEGITDSVFQMLKRGRVLEPARPPKMAVCWGGHSISRLEYEYTKEVGYHLGLRAFDICTGCGPGAMKGPMKGAAIGHAKQRIEGGRFIGLTEPGIIAAEPPNPLVSHLVVLPDIEKRLEAFVRLGHAIIVFPGGAGTAEEILYLLGILSHPDNQRRQLPLVFTGPAASRAYFDELDAFLKLTLGDGIASRYDILIGDAEAVAARVGERIKAVKSQRRRDGDAYYFNWLLKVPDPHQQPFEVSHESIAALRLDARTPRPELAVNLRRLFSAIVTGNVKDNGIRMVRKKGPFQIRADAVLMAGLDTLLKGFVAQGRMKLPGSRYEPCYEVVAPPPASTEVA